jgi:hypothetical protein
MTPQTYATHAHRPILTNVSAACWAAGLVGFVAALRGIAWGLPVGGAGVLLAVLCLISMSRLYTTRLQDRIILLEERVRAQRLLTAAQLARWDALSVKQVVALRFAPDAEFAALYERALAEGLKPDAIKRAITDWRGDYRRT